MKLSVSHKNKKEVIEIGEDESFDILQGLLFSVFGVSFENQKIIGIKNPKVLYTRVKDGQKLMLLSVSKVESAVEEIVTPDTWRKYCTRKYLKSSPMEQPQFVAKGKHKICLACHEYCFNGDINNINGLHSLGSLASSHILYNFVCECHLISNHSCKYISDKVMCSDKFATSVLQNCKESGIEQREMLSIQNSGIIESGNNNLMKRRIESTYQQVLIYENKLYQDKCRSLIPIQELEDKARNNSKENVSLEFKDELFKQLLIWYKSVFFKWVDAPRCEYCDSPTTAVGTSPPNSEESRYLAFTVEVYKCNDCSRITRFPRYNDPLKLLSSRRGRCGEFANCFTLIARSMGFDARFILDFTDHVWTEYYSENLGKWIHVDPSEGVIDSPLMYEHGWNKKLSYVFAFSYSEVRDVINRYTTNIDMLNSRRTLVHEYWLSNYLEIFNATIQSKLQPTLTDTIQSRYNVERIYMIEDNKNRILSSSESKGRQTGSVEWRMQRGEFGNESQVEFQDVENSEDQSVNFNEYKNIIDLTSLNFVGSAKFDYSKKSIILTECVCSQVGAVWSPIKVDFKQGFECIFTIKITGDGADGMAFVIQGTTSSTIIGIGGDGLGYEGIKQSLAIELDMYQNGNKQDPSHNHISIHSRGMLGNSSDHKYALATTDKFGVKLKDNKEHTIKITYVNNIIRVYIDNLTQCILKLNLDIYKHLNLTEGEGAFIGFTGATGGLAHKHEVLQWYFKCANKQ